MRLYDGLRHDILHEDNRSVIYDDIYNWMKARNLVHNRKVVKIEEKPYIKDESVDTGKALVNSDEVESVLNKDDSRKLKKSL